MPKALILVGGYGTRLRPLTFSCPKPLVPFANIPIVLHQIKALVKAGVDEIILAVNYQPQAMLDFLKDVEKEYNVKITISQEDVPLGTAGPIALARDILKTTDKFFMLNSDVICEFPLSKMLEFHNHHGKEGTIMVTRVEDPSKYGVVISDDTGKIDSFVEKPKTFVSDRINAGIYLFNSSIVDRIEPKPTSIERVIFPKMAADQDLYAMLLPGYWMDVGQPKDFLTGMVLHLESLCEQGSKLLAPESDQIKGNVLIHESAKIGAGAVLGPDVVIGPNVVVEEGARIERSTVMEGAKISSHSFIKSSIIGWESNIAKWTHVDRCVIGKDVTVKEGIVLIDTTVCPHKGVGADSTSTKIIL